MNRLASSIAVKVRRAALDRRGVASYVVIVAFAALVGALGFAVDVGQFLIARQQLQANTNAAALYGAYQWDQTNSQSTGVSDAETWYKTQPRPARQHHEFNRKRQMHHRDHRPPGVRVRDQQCDLADPDRNPSHVFPQGPRLQVLDRLGGRDGGLWGWQRDAIEHHVRARHDGFHADKHGRQRLHGSARFSPTKLQCALYGVQLVLKQLNPAIDKVGVMVFPGMSSAWSPSCSTGPNIVPYGQSGEDLSDHRRLALGGGDLCDTQGTLNDT